MSLCLPSTEGVESYSGDLWIGGGPYYYLPFGKDVSTIFASTPLIGSNSGEYLIDVKSIQIGGKNIPILHGTTKISTLAPYTVLHTSIYKALLAVFAGSAKMVRAPAVKPFGACFRSNGGRGVPVIKLVLRGGARWRIYGSNSLVKVCLGLLTEAISVAKEIVAIHTVFSYNRVRNPSNRTPRRGNKSSGAVSHLHRSLHTDLSSITPHRFLPITPHQSLLDHSTPISPDHSTPISPRNESRFVQIS
ncbi:unnamed protein product [Brassica oleracea var. botrytis]